MFFVLMNKKSKKCYSHFFNYINNNLLNLNGAAFITDYEKGLRKAIKTEFPDSKLYGCWFHFCQAVRRRITTKHKQVARFIRQNKEASLEYHKLLTLPLLPATHILDSFQIIKRDIEDFDHHFEFAAFLEYYESQWLQKVNIIKYKYFLLKNKNSASFLYIYVFTDWSK